MIRTLVLSAALALAPLTLAAQETDTPTDPETQAVPQPEAPMTMARIARIVQSIDADARAQGSAIEFTLDGIPVIVVADATADRMRAMVPIASAAGLSEADMLRMMQANFDSALDARYAVANGRLWGVFIHPLSPLSRDQFLSGLVQTVTVARTYGTAYTSGGAVFGGGDSNEIYRELLDKLKKQGEAL